MASERYVDSLTDLSSAGGLSGVNVGVLSELWKYKLENGWGNSKEFMVRNVCGETEE